MEHDEKIAKLEVNVATQGITIAELRQFNERILNEFHKCNAENRAHADRQVAELRQHTVEHVEKLRNHSEHQLAEQRRQHDEQMVAMRRDHEQNMAEMRKDHDQNMAGMRREHAQNMAEMRKHHDETIAALRGYIDHQGEILRAEAARREDKFDAAVHSLRSDMTNGFRWTTGAILTLAGLMIAMYAKLLGLY